MKRTKFIQIIEGPATTSIWIWHLLVTLDWWDLKAKRTRRFPTVNMDWDPK